MVRENAGVTDELLNILEANDSILTGKSHNNK